MNAQRRTRLSNIISKIEDAYYELESIVADETNAFENIPENLQGSERYERAEEICYNLEEAYSNLEDIISTLDECIN